MAEMNTSIYNNGILTKQSEPKINIDKNSFARTLRHIAAPVFDFFTKEVEPQEIENVNYESEIQKYEMRSAITQRILNDSDPNSRTRFNTVI